MYGKWMSLGIVFVAALAGCTHDRPHEYGKQRPPVDQADPRDTGLQSMDVVAASDRMSASLLSRPELNASKMQWQIVIDRVEDMTTDHEFRTNYQIFLERLKDNLSKQGHGRIVLIENREQFNNLRGRELEGVAPGPAPQAAQPDYSLYLKAMDMPGRGTNYFYLQFAMTDLHTRVIVWSDRYEVRAAR
ncbi:MAG TPA: hypothetical protein VH370_21620 [Humisphaera sp.]|jgi:PBP1b-binding outer membrane lipoprotein LpoB|nr:hypothetical protein [Humisphaera sp.]